MREKEILLVLDNVEHLLEGVGLLPELLQHAPNLKLLVTSRERLQLQGEWVVDLQGLPVPPSPPRVTTLPTMMHRQSAADVETYSAVTLFVERAQRVGFALSEQNRADVARICQLVDGMPLAIELAATWAPALSCREIAQELEHNLNFLASSMRDVPERHRSLRAVFDHSWKLLSKAERHVLPRLSVFRGGFTREAAEQAAGASLPLLLALVSKSLVQPAVDGWFAVHELVRQYAEAYLDTEPGNAITRPDESGIFQARRAHAVYYRALAEKVTPGLYGPDQATWLKRLEQEHDNIRAALIWALDQEAEIALRLASALRPFWKLGQVREGSTWLDKALQAAASSTRPASAAARAEALGAQSDLAIWLGLYTQARLLAEEALTLHRELGDRHGEAFSLLMLSWVAYIQDDYALGHPLATESLALYQELGDKLGTADVLGLLGIYSNENYAEARTYLEQSLTLYREIGHLAGVGDRLSDLGILVLRMGDFALARPWLGEGLAIQRSLGERRPTFSLVSLGELAFHEGNYEQARAYLEEGLAVSRETGEYHFSLWAFVRLGYVALRQGDARRARAIFAESQRQFNEASSKIGVVFALEGLASLAAARGQPERAVRLLGWADAMRAAVGERRPPVEQADLDRDLGTVRSQLDEAAFAAAYAEGRAMTIEQAVAYALTGDA
jgi:predicted ATPase